MDEPEWTAESCPFWCLNAANPSWMDFQLQAWVNAEEGQTNPSQRNILMITPRTASHAKEAMSGGKMRYPRSPVLNIDVTTKIIAESKVADSSHCMTATALKLTFPDAIRVSVDFQTIRFSNPKRRLRYVYLTPRVVQKAIIEFDQGRQVHPFSFRLQGGHVLAMYSRPIPQLSGFEIDQSLQSLEPTSKPIKKSERSKAQLDAINKANLARQGLRVDSNTKKGYVPDRVGGKAPPTTPFSRRRAFGLRAIER